MFAFALQTITFLKREPNKLPSINKDWADWASVEIATNVKKYQCPPDNVKKGI